MLIPFRSKASAEFFMFDHHVAALFELTAKPFTPQGAVAGVQAGIWAQALEAALNAHVQLEARRLDGAVNGQADGQADGQYVDSQAMQSLPVGLKQRAWPLLEMLRKAASHKVDVVWGSAV